MSIVRLMLPLLAAGLMLVLPWVVSSGSYEGRRVLWECHVPYEVLDIVSDGTTIRSMGNLSRFFNTDSTGIAQLSGRHEKTGSDGRIKVSYVYRLMEFTYALVGPYLKKNATFTQIRSTAKPPYQQALDENVYFQLLRLGRNTYALGQLGIPRQLCQEREAWLAPRLR